MNCTLHITEATLFYRVTVRLSNWKLRSELLHPVAENGTASSANKGDYNNGGSQS